MKVDVPEFPVSGVKFVVVIRYTPSDKRMYVSVISAGTET